MDKLKYIYLFIIFLGLGCEEENFQEENFVVEAFLFAGEPINRITIKSTQPITEASAEYAPISDAQVTLKRNGVSFALIFNNDLQRYVYDGTDLEVSAGDRFELEVKRGKRTARSETIVPQPTAGVTISGSKIIIPPITIRLGIAQELTNLFVTGRLTVRWDNPSDDLHFIAIENVVEGDPIFPEGFPIPEATLQLVQSFRYITAPTKNTTFSIPGLSLDTYGTYRAKVYRVNQEYADLYNNAVQDSRDLNQPPSNIRNALGIFTAFASDSVFFEIVKN